MQGDTAGAWAELVMEQILADEDAIRFAAKPEPHYHGANGKNTTTT